MVLALNEGQPAVVYICSRQICHSLAANLQIQTFGDSSV
ncbi:hypothetical protein VOA_001788 [Vibrio sp. RC586]|nr:hypothetical protein VOA_001788 [Vibrio sp. RC586]